MSQQGERQTRDDDWWNRLYDESAPDAGPDGSGDTLDDRFDSASGTVGRTGPAQTATPPSQDSVPPGPGAAPPGPGPVSDPPRAAPNGAPAEGPMSAPAPAPGGREREATGGTEPVPTAGDPNRAPDTPPATPSPPAAAPRGAGTARPPGPVEGTAPVAPARSTPPPATAAERPGSTASAPQSGTPAPPSDAAPSAPPDAPTAPPAGTAPTGTAPARPDGTPTAPPGGAAWWESVPAAPPPPADAVPGLPPGWAEGGPPPPMPPGYDAEQRVANAPRSLRTPPLDATGPPMTAPDEQFGPPRTAPPEQFAPVPRPRTGHVGDGPPTYDAEPTALPTARPDGLDELVADTVLDGARYGAYVLRAGSSRGDSARYRGEPRRDALLTARFGNGENALVLVAVASGARTSDRAHLAAADACHWIGGAIGRSHLRLAEDIRAGRRGDLKSGLHRLTDRSYGMLRARAGELGMAPEEYTASLRCLLLSADPACRTRVFFGVGHGGLFRLRGGVWQDIEPAVPEPGAAVGAPVVGYGSVPAETPQGDRLTMDLNTIEPARPYIDPPAPPGEPFRFRASVARPGDALLLCSAGLAEPLRGESALGKELAERWARPEPPGLAEFLADLQLRVKGYADDRTAVAVWEA
ncbi:protein phosphatase 2C domain-containing protein [Streptomyces sp. NBC_00083]|uniref:protein phosphatase 2C domain-containing protein n=1 Tax=Streptomyces sp. NBC_00083 TaxID=2975647 RepID=UPI0022544815|nr:protein phosphatase 2C domain-containing protein [Streptomyces sp. NBC_00083]MCX5386377.1 protein phosphatase 2C domain-containing protein [Streptomyces sp. NBC_00083]